MNDAKLQMEDIRLLHAENADAKPRIGMRKGEHISIVATGRGTQRSVQTGFDDVRFEHVALPEIDFDKINTATELLGFSVSAPLMVSAMTGGVDEAEVINLNIAEACNVLGLAMSVGSQRIALFGGSQKGFSRRLREIMGALPILGNLGAVQLNYGLGIDEARRAVEMIEADILVLHLNPLQEAIQIGGDRNFAGLLNKIEALARVLDVPIGVKEVGAGLAPGIGQKLLDVGVQIIDVAGVGGTSWSRVEAERGDVRLQEIAAPFHDWGIPTARALVEMKEIMPEGKALIASGGIRNGLDVARAIRLGATLAGQAAGALGPARESGEALAEHLGDIITQLKIAMFCTGSADLAALARAPLQPI